MSSIFTVTDIPRMQGQFTWSVAWPERGVADNPNTLVKIWDAAFDTGAYSVCFCLKDQSRLRVDSAVYEQTNGIDFFISRCQGIQAVAFEYEQDARSFVDTMEKHIMWNLLKKGAKPV